MATVVKSSFTEIPARIRTGGGGRDSFVLEQVRDLQPNEEATFQYDPNEDGDNFGSWAKSLASGISSARRRGSLTIETTIHTDPTNQTVTVYRLDGDLANRAKQRREQRAKTLASKMPAKNT